MEHVQVQNKIKLLFEKMAEPGYVMNNYYADGLIIKLSNSADPDIFFLESAPLISDLISDALTRTENAHNSITVFLTRILAIAAQKELQFTKIFSVNSERILKGFKEINSPTMNASLRVAYMEVALALVTHNSGIAWLVKTGVWKEILMLCNEKRTVFVVRQTYKFASKFVWKLNSLSDGTTINSVIVHILDPVRTKFDFLNMNSITSEEETEIAKTIEPMLQILLSIVSEDNQIQHTNLIIPLMTNEYRVQSHLYVLLDRLRREDLTILILRSIFWLTLARIFVTKPMTDSVVYNKDDFIDVDVMYFNTIQLLMQRRSATLVLDFCNAASLTWKLVWKEKTPILERDGRQINLHNQLVFLCLVPCLVYVKNLESKFCEFALQRVNEYITKLLTSTCEHIARAAYALRDLTLELDTVSITLQSVKRLTCLKNHLNNEQANIVFQALFYILKEYDPTNDEGVLKEESFEDSEEKVLFMTYVLDIVLYLVKNHNINWHESLEVICLYTIIFNILKRPNLSCKFIVTALNLIALTVKKFIPPNLSLLMESKPGSSMHEIGSLIFMRMHDRHWEVRDSALELLLVCTEISLIKFPPFQKQIMENKLINVAAAIAFNDYEFYVQVSALKCVGAASKVPALWDQLKMEYPDMQERLISILRNNQEGLVRKEACNVLCDIYQNLKLTPAFKQVLYEHMISSALSDFHWEVQFSALKFWKMVIKAHLTDQGMLDGTFPSVTFSRESRKIVTLNEAEIQKRLVKTLEELSAIGCLTVLVKLLHEDSEVDILETTLTISNDLLGILNSYKVPELLKDDNNTEIDRSIVDGLICEVEEENGNTVDVNIEPMTAEKAETIIEGILKADDINLLAHIYESRMSLETDGVEKTGFAQPKIKLVRNVTPYFFVHYLVSEDFKSILDNKKRWKDGIRSVSSLLDDVLGIYEHNEEINTLDCY